MKRKKLPIVFVSACLVLVLVAILSMTACAKPTPTQPFTVISLRSSPFGGSTYIMGTAMEETCKEHPWLRLSHTETPGTAWNLRFMNERPDAWPNTVIADSPLTMMFAIEGTGPFEGEPMEEIVKDWRRIASYNNMGIHYVTFDPDIKTLYDLEGKRLAVGTKSQMSTGQAAFLGPTALGINFEASWLGTKGAASALIEGKVDAAVATLYYSYDGSVVKTGTAYEMVAGTGRDFYQLDWTEAGAKQAQQVMAKDLIGLVSVPPNTLANQPETIYEIAISNSWGVHKSFPEELAYEVTKFVIEHHEEWAPRHGILGLLSPELMALRFPKENFHPGAVRAYEEAGIKWPE